MTFIVGNDSELMDRPKLAEVDHQDQPSLTRQRSHHTSDEEESQLPDAYSKLSFQRSHGGVIISTIILVIERELRQHKASQKAVAAKTQSRGINEEHNHIFNSESEDGEGMELTSSNHTSDDEPVDVIASQFEVEASLFLLVDLGLLLTRSWMSNVFNHIDPVMDHWRNLLTTAGL